MVTRILHRLMHPNVEPVKIEVHSPKNNPKDFENANIEAKLSKDTDPPIFDIKGAHL